MTNENTGTTSIIKDVELNWVHLAKPVAPFGTEVFDIRVDVPKKRESELANFGNVKAVMKDGKPNGMVSINLKKKALLRDGTPAKKVRVVNEFKQEIEDPSTIGNGSRGNVMVLSKPFEIKGPNGKVTKSGISHMLLAVQVTDMVKYEPKGSLDFDSALGEDSSSADDEF